MHTLEPLDTPWLLRACRVPTLFQHAILAARTIVTDLTDGAERARYLGYVGMSYGVGFALGPWLGGWVGERSVRAPAVAATLGSAASLLLTWALIPGGEG